MLDLVAAVGEQSGHLLRELPADGVRVPAEHVEVDAADQPLFEPAPGTTPLWSATRITGLFDAGVEHVALRQRLAARFGAEAAARLVVETLADQDWERVWLDEFRPMRFGARLWVCPAGQPPPVEGETVIIEDTATDKRVRYKDELAAEGIASMVVTPIKARDQIIGTLRLYSAQKRQYPEDMLIHSIPFTFTAQ